MRESVDSWEGYRKRRNMFLFAFLGYVPIVFVIAMATERLFHNITPASVVAIGWMIFFAVAGIRYQTFRCPRCGKWFFAKWWYHNIFTRRCVHCGLPKYASPETDHTNT